MAAKPFVLGGQRAWFHDEGHPAGYFHTYDALAVGGPPRKVHVLLPRDYEAGRRRDPVLYVHDADTAFWPGGPAGKSWQMAQGLEKSGVGPLIIVAVTPRERGREYTHGPALPGRPYGGADGYTALLADGVKAFIDANYRTDARAERTGILGSSHGGLISFYAASRRPDAFTRVGALSPSFWVGARPGEALVDSTLVAKVVPTLRAGTLKVWVDWGLVRSGGAHNSDIEERATRWGPPMVALLRQLGTQAVGYEDAVGAHDEDSWARRFPLALRYLYGG
jgi:predicted alpha/beta superfamily hydrolase